MPGTPVRDVAEHVEGERAEPGSEEAPGAAIPQRRMRLPTGERARAAWVGAGLLTMLTVPLIVALVVLARRTSAEASTKAVASKVSVTDKSYARKSIALTK